MMMEQFERFLLSVGYQKILTGKNNILAFFCMEEEKCRAVLCLECPERLEWTPEQYLQLKESLYRTLTARENLPVELLTVLITADLSGAKMLTETDDHCWVIQPYTRELVLYENQCGDMGGLRGRIEQFLSQKQTVIKKKNFDPAKFPWVSMGLVGINVLVFFACTFTGDLLYNIGAFSLENILADREWYRIITALFLHVDLNHLFSNMLLLYFTGDIAERYLGHAWFGVLYLAAGVGGNLLSMLYEWFTDFYNSVGASGAVFGIIGMLLALVLLHHGRLEQITTKRIVLMIVLSVYSGAASAEVNNMAHVGGLLTGFLLTLLIQRFLKVEERVEQTQ